MVCFLLWLALVYFESADVGEIVLFPLLTFLLNLMHVVVLIVSLAFQPDENRKLA